MRNLVLAVILVALVGCAGVPEVVHPSSSSKETPSPTPSVEAAIVQIDCDGYVAYDFKSFWSRSDLDRSLCEAEITNGGELPSAAVEAAALAGYDAPEDSATLYALCAEVDGYYATKNTELSQEQSQEASGMLALCPDFPKAHVVKANQKLSKSLERERASGVRFYDGSYRVGKEIKPGTYMIPRAEEGCYWERLDKSGDILDNNFISARTRVQVTIRSTDYTFHSTGCGEWRRA